MAHPFKLVGLGVQEGDNGVWRRHGERWSRVIGVLAKIDGSQDLGCFWEKMRCLLDKYGSAGVVIMLLFYPAARLTKAISEGLRLLACDVSEASCL